MLSFCLYIMLVNMCFLMINSFMGMLVILPNYASSTIVLIKYEVQRKNIYPLSSSLFSTFP